MQKDSIITLQSYSKSLMLAWSKAHLGLTIRPHQ